MLNLIHGDCLEVMKTLPDASIDAIITDPPYGTTACKWDSAIPFEPMWKELNRIIKDNGAIVLFGSQPFTSALVMSNPKMFKYEWIWNKVMTTNFAMAKKQPLRCVENILLFYSNQPTYNPQFNNKETKKPFGKISTSPSDVCGNLGLKKQSGVGYPKNILTFPRPNNLSKDGNLHPTQKPVALLEYLIKTYTNENEIVLDFTMGSGTTGVACKNLNRNFIGIEKDDNYFKIASARINA
jgi:site-specific DNA-methyltransferase (adenine-specific)